MTLLIAFANDLHHFCSMADEVRRHRGGVGDVHHSSNGSDTHRLVVPRAPRAAEAAVAAQQATHGLRNVALGPVPRPRPKQQQSQQSQRHASQQPPPPVTHARYEVLRTIGRGSFGTAVLVREATSQRQYVLKEVREWCMQMHMCLTQHVFLARWMSVP